MSTKKVRVLVLVCSTRPGALGPVIGDWVTKAVASSTADLGVDLVSVGLGELDLPFLDEEEHPSTQTYRNQHTRDWSAMVDAADGFIVVTPEYNYGMPATLKNALDYLSPEWAWKPIGFVSYGNTSAGTRSVQHAKQVVTTMRLVPLGATVAIRIADAVEDNHLRPDENRDAAAIELLEELVRVSRGLEPLRERERDGVLPGPIRGSYLRRLTAEDAAEVIVLQRCCWVDEAVANETLAIPPLHESLAQVRDWLTSWQAWGLWLDGRLLGMVRARRAGDDWHIGRLAVVPDMRGQHLGDWLRSVAEDAREPGCRDLVLFTGVGSEANIKRYEKAGYQLIPHDDGPGTVGLGKPVQPLSGADFAARSHR